MFSFCFPVSSGQGRWNREARLQQCLNLVSQQLKIKRTRVNRGRIRELGNYCSKFSKNPDNRLIGASCNTYWQKNRQGRCGTVSQKYGQSGWLCQSHISQVTYRDSSEVQQSNWWDFGLDIFQSILKDRVGLQPKRIELLEETLLCGNRR